MTQHQHIDNLAIELFHVFSRVEYSLKASGYNNGDGVAKANWRSFSLDLEGLISKPPTPELKEAIDFILSTPPKKQIIKNNIIEWDASEPSTKSQADKLLTYVRRVRNNLFHGGKFNGHWFEPERSEQLLRYSLVILLSCVKSIEKVNDAYYG